MPFSLSVVGIVKYLKREKEKRAEENATEFASNRNINTNTE
jgi:hypothetical protein